MASVNDPVCFQCGQSFSLQDEPPTLPDGTPCQSCAERLLESLPSLLPGTELDEEALESVHAPLRGAESDPPARA